MSYYTTTIGSTQAGYTQPIGSISGGSAPTKKTETEAALEAAYINSTIKTQPNMTEELMLQLAAKIENGSKVSTDGYTKPVGYTSTVGYSAPIGSIETKSEDEAALQAAAIQQQIIGMPPVKPGTEQPAGSPAREEDLTRKKSLLDRIKEKPLVYAVIAAVLAFIGYSVYKSKKG